ncbi:hypothetical protein MKW92_040945, partial [Papaver armeniacum]
AHTIGQARCSSFSSSLQGRSTRNSVGNTPRSRVCSIAKIALLQHRKQQHCNSVVASSSY